MSQRRLWIAAAIIGFVIVAGFIFSVPHTTRDTAPAAKLAAPTPVPVVALRDVYKKGSHTLTGSLTTPTACTTASTTASLVGDASTTESILLAIALSTDTQVCLQLPTLVTFSVGLAAPALLPITVTVNGIVASTTTP